MPLPPNAVLFDDDELVVGVEIKIHPGDRNFQSEIQFAAPATSDSSVPSTSIDRLALKAPGVTRHRHIFPEDIGQSFFYRARHVFPGYTGGAFSDWVCARPVSMSLFEGGVTEMVDDGGRDDEKLFMVEGRRRGDTIYSTDAQIKNSVRVTDGSGNYLLNRHNESGLAEHAEAVTFSADFESTPRITFVPQKAKVYSNSTDLGSTSLGSTEGQFMDLAAEALTVSGFTLRAVIATSQESSANTDGFSAVQNATAPENGDVTLSDDGDVVYSNLEDADVAAAAVYRATFQVSDSSKLAAGLFKVELGFNASSTSTGFTLGDSRSFDAVSNSTQEELSVNTALGVDYDLRLRLSYTNAPATSALVTVTAHGEDNAVPGVRWNKISTGIEESMTPSTGQAILWQATETP